MLDQAPCGPAVPCLSRQARAAVMVRLRGEADAGHRSAVSGHRSPVKQVIGRQCHSGVSVIRVNTGMVNFRKFLLPNKAVIFLKIFREIYICPNSQITDHSKEGLAVTHDDLQRPVRVIPENTWKTPGIFGFYPGFLAFSAC